ncbi:zinc-dependent peptidase [Sulfitobacter aestuariivivens]|uniref:Zinc-dependent peptidase n=1 Tax=Sulfitobacter aestuariivivens TaxID=2766981 RepID=A0A927HDT5_9RHOB|nr:M90 family metallopeptidase [Sulfitobacter aestuariivivens]MBD3663176.1 zinc-dependent peptidase [Sulfitobacter aestuariivivens]
MTFLLLAAIFVSGFFVYRAWQRRQHRADLLDSLLHPHEKRMLKAQIPILQRLPAALWDPLEGKINLFLDQVRFIGCNGLEVTEEMELSIAAQACLLVVNSDAWYDNLTTVMIYPGAFKSLRKDYDGYVVTEEEVIRSGESWSRGPVILSWEDSHRGALNAQDGHNVVLHEFAHQLDDMSGHTDGGPMMAEGQSFETWSRVIRTAFERHKANVEHGRKTALDAYGATNHQEFFAVAVETFFEKPSALHAEEPEVYAELVKLLQVDPRVWR